MKLETSILGTLFGFSWLSRRQEEMGAFLTPITAFGAMYMLSEDCIRFILFGFIFWCSWGYWMTTHVENIKELREEMLRELAK
jgi:hypothetical protein